MIGSRTFWVAGAAFLLLGLGHAQAQTPLSETQRDIDIQRRIEQGLRSGRLTTDEAARLERGASRIDRMESRALRDGTLSDQERRRIDRAQDRENRAIGRLENNGRNGDPNSWSSRRMQGDVQRNLEQERRIRDGIASGRLNNREVARLEGRESRIERGEWKAGRDGHVGRGEQGRIQQAENNQSRRIWREKHDGDKRNQTWASR